MGIGITAIGPTATNIKVGKNIGYWTGELRSQVPYLSRQQPAITAVLNTRVRIDFASLTLKPATVPSSSEALWGDPLGSILGRVLINRQPNADSDAPPNVRYWG